MQSLEDRIRALVADALGVEARQVTPEAHFAEDLGADSLDRISLTQQLEEEFGLAIPDGDADRLLTVGQVVTYVTDALEERAQAEDAR